MPKVNLLNQQGQELEAIELSEEIFGIEPNLHVMHEAVVNYLANQRQGTHAAKTRAEVRGGGRKPFRQKGTGRARQGSIRAPHYVGGGVSFAKKPRDFSYVLPKKVRRLALKSALSQKVLDNQLLIIDKFELEAAKTKQMVKVFSDLNTERKVLLILGERNEAVERATRNIPNTMILRPNTLNTYQILNHQSLVITKDALEKIEEVYK